MTLHFLKKTCSFSIERWWLSSLDSPVFCFLKNKNLQFFHRTLVALHFLALLRLSLQRLLKLLLPHVLWSKQKASLNYFCHTSCGGKKKNKLAPETSFVTRPVGKLRVSVKVSERETVESEWESVSQTVESEWKSVSLTHTHKNLTHHTHTHTSHTQTS